MHKYSKPRNSKDLFFHINGPYPITHTHNAYWEFMFIFTGSLLHKINGRSITVEQNTLCLIRPDDVHSIHGENKASRHINLGVTSKFFESFLSLFDQHLYKKLLNTPLLSIHILPGKATEILNTANAVLLSDQNAYEHALQLLFLIMIKEVLAADTGPKSSHHSKATTGFIRLLDDPNNLSFELHVLFSMLDYSYSHMNRVFRKEIGMTPSQYYKKKKLEYAKILLTDFDLSMEAIASTIGYETSAHFSTFFKSATGMTPSQYKARHQSTYIITDY